MNFMQATPRSRYKSNRFIWQAGAAMGLATLLIACGGGGGGDSAGGAPAVPPPPITRTEAVVGDYFVYAMTSTPSVPAGTAPSAYNMVITYHNIAPDGANQRITTRSDVPVVQLSTYNDDEALVSQENGGAAPCSYSPPAQSTPPYPRAVGQAWNGTSVTDCAGSVTTAVLTGEIVARENLVLPSGTFDAHRTSRTTVSTNTTRVSSVNLTCWYSVERGVLLRCDSTTTTTPAGSTIPSSVVSTTQILTGMGGPDRLAQGAVLPRFQGSWRVQYSGGASGICSQLYVNATGTIRGNCTPTGGSAFAITGTVNVNGAVSIALPTGGALTGTLTAPYAGTGTWVDSGLSGTWSAVHN